MADNGEDESSVDPQDAALQAHLAECVECWEDMAEQEERWGIDLRLPEHPEVTTADAAEAHSGRDKVD